MWESILSLTGSREDFEAFGKEYGERAFQFAYRLSGNIEEAKDLVQEAFYRVLKNWDRYDRSRTLDAWFFTILRNVFLDGRKRYERRHAVSLERPVRESDGESSRLEDVLPDEEEAVLAQLERKESAQAVRATLDRLAYDHRVALTLCDMEAMSYEEMSQVLDIPVGTVRSRINRARSAFRKEFVRHMEEAQ